MALKHFYSEDFVVTNPFNQILNKRPVLDTVESGSLKHTSFEREIEYLRIYENTAVVMGRETVVDTGPTVNSRYTEVWIQRDGHWQVVARHAHVIAQH